MHKQRILLKYLNNFPIKCKPIFIRDYSHASIASHVKSNVFHKMNQHLKSPEDLTKHLYENILFQNSLHLKNNY